MPQVNQKRAEARFFLSSVRGILPNRPYAVIDGSVGKVAQTDDGMTLAYFTRRSEARTFMWERNRLHWSGACPEYIDWHGARHGAYEALCLYLVDPEAEDTRRAVAATLAGAGYPNAARCSGQIARGAS